MRPLEVSTRIFSLLMFNNYFENTFSDSSFCNMTRIFVVNLRVVTYNHTFDYFKQVLISSVAVDLEITGSVWQKSPSSKIIILPKRSWLLRESFNVRSSASNARLYAIVHSSLIIILQFYSTFVIVDFLAIFHVNDDVIICWCFNTFIETFGNERYFLSFCPER